MERIRKPGKKEEKWKERFNLKSITQWKWRDRKEGKGDREKEKMRRKELKGIENSEVHFRNRHQ